MEQLLLLLLVLRVAAVVTVVAVAVTAKMERDWETGVAAAGEEGWDEGGSGRTTLWGAREGEGCTLIFGCDRQCVPCCFGCDRQCVP